MRAFGYIPEIYDEPPFDDFNLILALTSNPLEVKEYLKTPYIWILTFLDWKLKNEHRTEN